MSLYTIGHSNHTPERLFELVAPFSLTHLIDIRRVPFSGRNPFFNSNSLRLLCHQQGIVYEWWGETLGGSVGTEYTLDEIAKSKGFLAAVRKLSTGYGEGSGKVACLLCAEGDPRKCHRSMIIGPALFALSIGGIELQHILPDGTLLAQSELEEEVSLGDRSGTLPLFDES